MIDFSSSHFDAIRKNLNNIEKAYKKGNCNIDPYTLCFCGVIDVATIYFISTGKDEEFFKLFKKDFIRCIGEYIDQSYENMIKIIKERAN